MRLQAGSPAWGFSALIFKCGLHKTPALTGPLRVNRGVQPESRTQGFSRLTRPPTREEEPWGVQSARQGAAREAFPSWQRSLRWHLTPASRSGSLCPQGPLGTAVYPECLQRAVVGPCLETPVSPSGQGQGVAAVSE